MAFEAVSVRCVVLRKCWISGKTIRTSLPDKMWFKPGRVPIFRLNKNVTEKEARFKLAQKVMLKQC